MVTMKIKLWIKEWRLIALLSFLISAHSCAIDNPDAKNGIKQFEERSQPYKQAIDNPKNTSRAYLVAYDNYQKFLDDELNRVYSELRSHLSAPRKVELQTSQKNWLVFRDAEFLLINNNWTNENFGSSSNISRGAYRCALIEHRVRELLSYAANY